MLQGYTIHWESCPFKEEWIREREERLEQEKLYGEQ